jgi:hypothetical protein
MAPILFYVYCIPSLVKITYCYITHLLFWRKYIFVSCFYISKGITLPIQLPHLRIKLTNW